jgi:hypothetical protein
MASSIGPITNSIFEKIIKELNCEDNKNIIIDNILKPILSDISCKYYSYYCMIVFLLCSIMILLIIILVILIKKN